MGMASNTDDEQQVEREFKQLNSFFERLKKEKMSEDFNVLSMGMSGDYALAIRCGSNMIRVGSKVFE